MRCACSHAKVFVHKNVQFSNIAINDFCKYQDIWGGGNKIRAFTYKYLHNNHIYRAPSVNVKLFINGLNNIIKKNFINRSKFYYMW